MYLVFDFETTGVSNIDVNIPQRAIQLAWIILDSNFKTITTKSFYFKGQSEINTHFHTNLSVDFLNNAGYSAMDILGLFLKDVELVLSKDGCLVAHNIEFDYKILRNELKLTFDMNFNLEEKLLYCTMKRSILHCKLPKIYRGENVHKKQSVGYKYPKLIELYRTLFNAEPSEVLHDALNDVMVTSRCFIAMKALNL